METIERVDARNYFISIVRPRTIKAQSHKLILLQIVKSGIVGKNLYKLNRESMNSSSADSKGSKFNICTNVEMTLFCYCLIVCFGFILDILYNCGSLRWRK